MSYDHRIFGYNTKGYAPLESPDSQEGAQPQTARSSGKKYVVIKSTPKDSFSYATRDKSRASNSKDVLKYIKQSVDNAEDIKSMLDDGFLVKHKFAFVESGKFIKVKQLLNRALSFLGITSKGKIEKTIEKTIDKDIINQLKEKMKVNPESFAQAKEAVSHIVFHQNMEYASVGMGEVDLEPHKQILENLKTQIFENISREEAKEFVELAKKHKVDREVKNIKVVLEYILLEKNDNMVVDGVALFPGEDDYRI